MPIISFSTKDILRNKIVTPGWYRVRVESVGEKMSADQGSTNWPVEVVVIRHADDGTEEFAGVPVGWNFNSKAPSFAIGFIEALGVEIKPEQRYELKMAEGQDLEVFIETGVFQGRQKNEVNHKYRKLRPAA